jgi:NAD-dependent dihydropyrimidine dehydrogenase PreA subunit
LDIARDVIQTAFRFFPFPTSTGVHSIGEPGRDAPVLVTCNFDLTVRRVTKALQGIDCYLLVAPSKGINVWCAAGGGMFNAHSVISVLKTSGIAERVDHRRLILPQLSAPGIDIARVERQTGWQCLFGPVYARDIPEYLEAIRVKNEAMRQVTFPLRDRLEMAVMWAAPMSVVTTIPLAVMNWRLLPGALALIWGFSLFIFAFFDPVLRFVPGPVGLVKTVILGLLATAGLVAYGVAIGGWSAATMVGWSLAVLTVALILGFDLDGSSPVNAGSTGAYWGRKWPGVFDLWEKIGYHLEPWFGVEVDGERCNGCSTCVAVCPKPVFELRRLDGMQRSHVARMEECVQCTACVKQCPSEAIRADPPVKVFGPMRVDG